VIALFLILLAAPKLQPCHVPGVDEEVRCGRYEVYENRAARSGRKIALNIVVLPATGSRATSDPLVFLAGGGVAPATRYAAFLGNAFPHLRKQRDILLVDQRGTGGSNPLDCDVTFDRMSAEYREETRFRASVRRCRAQLESKADVRLYTTPLAMDDLDDVRAWLGYSRLNLYGASYGTSAAMVYVRQHPTRVRTVTLQGVVPLDGRMWIEIPRSTEEVLQRVFAASTAQFPRFEHELRSLTKRLAQKPEAGIDDVVLRDFVFKMLYSAERIRDLPLLIHLADQGDIQPLASKIAVKSDSEIPKGVYFSIVCSELIPQFDARDVSAAVAGTFLGGFRLEREIDACDEWVRGPLPPRFFAPVTSNVPALVMNGELDHLTPPRYGQHVAQSLPRARHIVLPRRGHNDVDECITGMIEAFIAAGDAARVDASCLAKTDELSFTLRRSE
jgi:pimeloyl-ACP methyl ester carboxylesterase